MKSNCIHLSFSLLVMVFIRIVNSVPHEFCLDTFDDDDCGEYPTPVFYYYKPGSRCEIRTWRGCPTLNKFPNQFSCHHFCVMRNWGDGGEAMLAVTEDHTEDPKEEWIEDLAELEMQDMEAMYELVEDVVENMEHNSGKMLSLQSNIEETEEVEVASDGEPEEVITT